MTDEELKIAQAFKKCADAHLPADFADRLVRSIREKDAAPNDDHAVKRLFPRIALLAASLTLLLGFVPIVFDTADEKPAAAYALRDEIRPSKPLPRDPCQVNGWALFGFCRDIIRRVKPLVLRSRKRDDEE